MSFIKNVTSAVTNKFLDRPEYDVIKCENGYEERKYKQCKWVSTKVKAMRRNDAMNAGFWKCFNYIQGKNEGETKIDMTVPVTGKVEPGAGPNCESTFTVSFFIPPVHQEKPPAPTDPDVFIEERPEMTVLVQKFGGFANEDNWISEAEKLTKKVQDNHIHCDENCWYTVGYNSPFQLFGRTNEVWFMKVEN